MPLRLEAQEALTSLLEGGLLHLLAQNEPGDDPLGRCAEVATKEGLRVSNSSIIRIADQNPAQGHGAGNPVLYQTAVPERGSTVRSLSPYQWATVIGPRRGWALRLPPKG